MARMLIVIALGAVLAIGAVFAVTSALAGVANGTPSHASIYQYGTR